MNVKAVGGCTLTTRFGIVRVCKDYLNSLLF